MDKTQGDAESSQSSRIPSKNPLDAETDVLQRFRASLGHNPWHEPRVRRIGENSELPTVSKGKVIALKR